MVKAAASRASLRSKVWSCSDLQKANSGLLRIKKEEDTDDAVDQRIEVVVLTNHSTSE
jgi:hypothetical protein